MINVFTKNVKEYSLYADYPKEYYFILSDIKSECFVHIYWWNSNEKRDSQDKKWAKWRDLIDALNKEFEGFKTVRKCSVKFFDDSVNVYREGEVKFID